MVSNWLSGTVNSKDRQCNGQWKTKDYNDKQFSPQKHDTELKIEQHEPYLEQ